METMQPCLHTILEQMIAPNLPVHRFVVYRLTICTIILIVLLLIPVLTGMAGPHRDCDLPDLGTDTALCGAGCGQLSKESFD